jgi:hypothetical protein
MTRRSVLKLSSLQMTWKLTAKRLKLYRMQFINDLDWYNHKAWELIELYRKIEYSILQENQYYNKLRFLKILQEFEDKFSKGK